jgi:UDP-N-acetyl-D-mannosaminuronic acid transferase (WecB/TagA/CpsF family)
MKITDSDKITILIGLGSFGLLAYNTYLNRKQSNLNGYMGAIEEQTDSAVSVLDKLAIANVPTLTEDNAVNSISLVADTYFNKAYSSFDALKNNPDVQAKLKELGVDVYIKDLSAERVKNIIAGYGVFKLMTALKSNALKIGILGGGLYIASKNRQKIQDAYESVIA